jgi:hypothetical protein
LSVRVKGCGWLRAPKNFRVNKLPWRLVVAQDFCVDLPDEEHNIFSILQQKNQIFRQIELLTNDLNGIYCPYILFVDAKGIGGPDEGKLALERFIREGFLFNGRRFLFFERSASMVRTSIFSFVDERLFAEITERVTMGLADSIGETVLAKWYAYRGLMLSSCHCLENYMPKIIIVPDCEIVREHQYIKYLVDVEVPFTDKEGNQRTWKQKDIEEGYKDIKCNLFDGCGIQHPAITKEICEQLDIDPEIYRSFLVRLPLVKGMIFEMDYVKFFQQRGVTSVKDIWGIEHSVTPDAEPMIIATESMYKGYKYFRHYNDVRDWEAYWDAFRRYQHVFGVVQVNASPDDEEVYRRGNYQILQDLDLNYGEFRHLADYSMEWAEKIIDGDDWVHTACFLGMTKNFGVGASHYADAVFKNPAMVREKGVRQHLVKSLSGALNEFKCGGIYLKATNKFIAPDLIMMMEHIGGLELVGCMDAGEFWCQSKYVEYRNGEEYHIVRNPHICHSEHTLLTSKKTSITEEYFGNLHNVCIINSKDLTPQRCQGCDYDGDRILLLDEPLIRSGVNKNATIVIDIEDKATTMVQADTHENKINVVKLGLMSIIGEASNCASTYHNKTPQTIAQKKKYDRNIDILATITGKAIDELRLAA